LTFVSVITTLINENCFNFCFTYNVLHTIKIRAKGTSWNDATFVDIEGLNAQIFWHRGRLCRQIINQRKICANSPRKKSNELRSGEMWREKMAEKSSGIEHFERFQIFWCGWTYRIAAPGSQMLASLWNIGQIKFDSQD